MERLWEGLSRLREDGSIFPKEARLVAKFLIAFICVNEAWRKNNHIRMDKNPRRFHRRNKAKTLKNRRILKDGIHS